MSNTKMDGAGALGRIEDKGAKPEGKPPLPTPPLPKTAIHIVELRPEFILVNNWFIDVGKITSCYIDSGRIVVHQMGGMSLIFDNDELTGDVSGNILLGPEFRALSDYLQERFNAQEVMTPVDKAFASGNYPKERDGDNKSKD